MMFRHSRKQQVLALLLATMMIALACGNDDESGDTAEPAPEPPATTEASEPPTTTEAPEAPATTEAPEAPVTTEAPEAPVTTEAPEAPVTTEAPEAPATTEAPAAAMSLEGLVVDADTTGGDLLDGVSEAEASCVSEEAGDAFQSIVDATLADGGADPFLAEPMAACLTEDNFVVFSTAIIAANAEFTSDESRSCLTDLGRAHPELAYITFGVVGESTVPFDPETLRSFAGDFYNCATASEKINMTLRTLDQMAVLAPVTGSQLLGVMGEDVVNCYLGELSLTREQFEAVVEAAFVGGTATTVQGPDCLTTDTITELVISILSTLFGGMSNESADCIRDFGAEYPEFLDLMAIGNFAQASMTEEEFVELSAPGLKVFDCFTIAELLPIQAFIIEMVTNPRPAL